MDPKKESEKRVSPTYILCLYNNLAYWYLADENGNENESHVLETILSLTEFSEKVKVIAVIRKTLR